MSMSHIILTAAGTSATTTLPINSKHPTLLNSKEHIRERLNMHVKKRIQGQDMIPQYSLPAGAGASSSVYPGAPLSTSIKSTHPFLMSNASVAMPPMVVFANSLITVNNNMGRTIPLPQMEHQQSYKAKMQQPKKLTKKKKTAAHSKKYDKKPMNQQAENLILNSTKYSDDSNDYSDRNEAGSNLLNGIVSPTHPNNNNGGGGGGDAAFEKSDQRLNNSPDILSMVLSLKKNALMHDPYVIQFISSIR